MSTDAGAPNSAEALIVRGPTADRAFDLLSRLRTSADPRVINRESAPRPPDLAALLL